MPLRTLLNGEGTDAACGESVEDTIRDDIDLTQTVHLNEKAAGAVDVDERPRLAYVYLLAVTDRLLGVVRAPLLHRALAKAGNNLAPVSDELDDSIERLTLALMEFVEVGDLVKRARVSVEQETLAGVILLDTARDERVGQSVRHIVAGINDRLDLDTERRLACDVVAEDVTRRNGRDAEAGGESRR